MLDFLGNTRRTHYCGTLRKEHEGSTVTVTGFVQRSRDLGQLIFVDLRDRTGIVQLAFDDNTAKEVFEKAGTLRSEYVIAATGEVRIRSAINTEIPTGEVEVAVSELKIFSAAITPPFEIVENSNVKDELRLKYRYLDLRRPDLQRNIMMRHKITKTVREYFYDNGFIEIETPMLIKSTPEGARDYLVPSRLYHGEFYALPQSPQIYKQLLMVSGFDRYIQIARCFRDEDLRADRQPEFTQIDVEMSYVDTEDVLKIGEGFMKKLFKDVLDIDIPTPLPRLTYREAMESYGSDKPDVRFDMKIVDLSDTVKNCGFGVFASAIENGGSVRAVCAKGAVDVYTRKMIDKLTDSAKGIGAKGLAWIRYTNDGIASSFGKFMSEDEMNSILTKVNAEVGDVVVIVADKDRVTLPVLGALRLEMAKKLDIIDKTAFAPLWIVEFPFFEYNEETGGWDAMHHPFTAPLDECLEYFETDPGAVRAKAYDLVLNGVELSSGSIRITNPNLQSRIFAALGLSEEEAETKFGFLTNAFKYGAPPHGGFGIGLDRLCMMMLGCDSLRDVVAFPKMQNARELMSECPASCDSEQLNELGISIITPENDK
ncbi:MAG: aspartate--tRNA ligase [Clostridia bacterium]|nr:aspartate--tRNA ligase [Clostridia bacterium]MEE1024584.1 aspartate--tRNA ligase [Acutalibacteraceae bacterium]